MSKPREWWIYQGDSNGYMDTISLEPFEDSINLIEKRAYDELLLHAKNLAEITDNYINADQNDELAAWQKWCEENLNSDRNDLGEGMSYLDGVKNRCEGGNNDNY